MHFLVTIDRRGVRVAIDDGRDTDRIVIVEQLDKSPPLVFLGRLIVRGRDLDVPRAVAQDSGRLAGARVFFDLTRTVNPEADVDAALLQRQRVERGVGASREQNGVIGCGLVELVACRVALFLESRDKDLADDDPPPGPRAMARVWM